MAKLIKITLKKSTIGCTEKQIANVQGLGLKKTSSTVYRKDTPEVRGMIQKVIHLLNVEKADTEPKKNEKISYVSVASAAKPEKKTAKKAATEQTVR